MKPFPSLARIVCLLSLCAGAWSVGDAAAGQTLPVTFESVEYKIGYDYDFRSTQTADSQALGVFRETLTDTQPRSDGSERVNRLMSDSVVTSPDAINRFTFDHLMEFSEPAAGTPAVEMDSFGQLQFRVTAPVELKLFGVLEVPEDNPRNGFGIRLSDARVEVERVSDQRLLDARAADGVGTLRDVFNTAIDLDPGTYRLTVRSNLRSGGAFGESLADVGFTFNPDIVPEPAAALLGLGGLGLLRRRVG